tara:strand:+ start:5371 stop:5586 length:216 start_codon:yes stop_codon:yes gene_type:complete
MKDNRKPDDPGLLGEQYLTQMISTQDPDLLRSMLFEMVIVVGQIYKRTQLHLLLHPVFFLAGFLSCYFFSL